MNSAHRFLLQIQLGVRFNLFKAFGKPNHRKKHDSQFSAERFDPVLIGTGWSGTRFCLIPFKRVSNRELGHSLFMTGFLCVTHLDCIYFLEQDSQTTCVFLSDLDVKYKQMR